MILWAWWTGISPCSTVERTLQCDSPREEQLAVKKYKQLELYLSSSPLVPPSLLSSTSHFKISIHHGQILTTHTRHAFHIKFTTTSNMQAMTPLLFSLAALEVEQTVPPTPAAKVKQARMDRAEHDKVHPTAVAKCGRCRRRKLATQRQPKQRLIKRQPRRTSNITAVQGKAPEQQHKV